MSKIEEQVENLISKTVNDLGYSIYDVMYVKEGKDYYLRIFIDKQDIVNVEDCVKVSELINPILDKADPIDGSYVLDVSSVERG